MFTLLQPMRHDSFKETHVKDSIAESMFAFKGNYDALICSYEADITYIPKKANKLYQWLITASLVALPPGECQ